jgi:hypothetical protein
VPDRTVAIGSYLWVDIVAGTARLNTG